MPSAESLVGWLLEHQEVQVTELSDSDSLSSVDALSDSTSISDDFDDLEGAFGEVSIPGFPWVMESGIVRES